LNEGYADIIGLLINGKGFILGEGTPIEERGGRDLTNPNKYDAPAVKGGDYWFPDYYLKDYASLAEFLKEKDAERKAKGEKNEIKYLKDIDKGGVHHNSTVVGHAAYLMNKAGAFSSKEQMAKVWYNSLFMLSSRANFEDCALAVIKTAQNFNLSEASIKIIRNAFMDTKMLEDTNFKVSGQVKDDSNKVLSNVKVTLTHKVNSSITYSTNTNNSGNYNFEHIPRGPYVIMAVKASYNDASEDLVGIAGETKELNLQMSKVKENSTSPNNEDFSGVAFFRGKLKCDEIKNREMKVLNLGGASSDQKVNPKAYYGYILTADWHLYGLYEKEVADGYEYTCTREFNNLNILGAGIEGNNYVCSSDSDKIYNLNGSEYTPIGWHNLECYVHRKYRNSSMDPIYVRDNIDFLNTDYYSGFENEGSDAKGKYYSTVWSTRLIAVVKEDGIYLESYKEITKHYAGPSNAKEVFQTLHDSKLFLPQKEFDGKIISVKSTFYGQINQKNIPPIIIKTDKSYYGYIRDNYECEQSNKCTYKLTKIKVLSNNYNKIVYADRWGFVDNNYNVYIYSFIDNEFHSN